ncbi:hypothetical protein VNO77_19872 [Canavalia gladiata]|uniref:Uncharacterized protein n=1 Tax=Canavalia gladiata TaxID=3824 RepID=A0AAN9LSD2_CANGL
MYGIRRSFSGKFGKIYLALKEEEFLAKFLARNETCYLERRSRERSPHLFLAKAFSLDCARRRIGNSGGFHWTFRSVSRSYNPGRNTLDNLFRSWSASELRSDLVYISVKTSVPCQSAFQNNNASIHTRRDVRAFGHLAASSTAALARTQGKNRQPNNVKQLGMVSTAMIARATECPVSREFPCITDPWLD